MKSVLSLLRFHSIRFWERIFSPSILYGFLVPIASLRAAFKNHPAELPLPAAIGRGTVIPGTVHSWRNYYMNHTLGCLPDRLAAPEWLSRCTFSGLEELREAQRRGQPAIVAVCHFGAFQIVRFWLQAAGIRTSALIAGRAEARPYMDRLRDEKTLFPEFPPVFYPHQLREVSRFLAAGHVLVIAVDEHTGNLLEVPVVDGVCFQMATGALRLAARHKARLFPCNIVDRGRWRFQVELGQPVPEALLAGKSDMVAAGKYLLEGLLPGFRAHPEQCCGLVFNSFRPPSQTSSNLHEPERTAGSLR